MDVRGNTNMAEYTQEELKEFDDLTLACCWDITNVGRQYEGVEEDRRAIGREMARRLKEDN